MTQLPPKNRPRRHPHTTLRRRGTNAIAGRCNHWPPASRKKYVSRCTPHWAAPTKETHRVHRHTVVPAAHDNRVVVHIRARGGAAGGESEVPHDNTTPRGAIGDGEDLQRTVLRYRVHGRGAGSLWRQAQRGDGPATGRHTLRQNGTACTARQRRGGEAHL